MRTATWLATTCLAGACAFGVPSLAASIGPIERASAQLAAADLLSESVLADATGMRVRLIARVAQGPDERPDFPPASDMRMLVFAACMLVTVAAARRYADRP